MMPIKVLVVDDSALIRSLLSEIISKQSDMQLVGAAKDAYEAKDMVNKFLPGVITLDVEMPKVDGLVFLEKLMKAKPTPVLMISTMTEKGSEETVRALELGAVDYIPKPKFGVSSHILEYQTLIVEKIRLASKAKVKKPFKIQHVKKGYVSKSSQKVQKVIAIGASTGGCEAIKLLLTELPSNFHSILIAQHMPSGFTKSFANRLNTLSTLNVKEAEHNDKIKPGYVFLAPGGKHMTIKKDSAGIYRICLEDSALVMGHKPSVDVLFDSVAKCHDLDSTGVLLTGMGKDGAKGLLNIKQSGGHTIVQDEASCVVYGMPREAVKIGANSQIVSLDKMANTLVNL